MAGYESRPGAKLIQFDGAGNQACWPRCPSDKVSIFEAIQIVGKAKFGTQWDGSEFDVVDWTVSPNEALANSSSSASLVSHAPQPIKPEFASIDPATVSRPRPQPRLSDESRQRYAASRLANSQPRWEANQAALSRLMDVSEWIAQRCRDDVLKSFARPSEGGVLWPMLSTEWNTESVLERFVSNGGHERFFSELNATCDAKIFFNRADIEREIATLPHTPLAIAVADLAQLSPYLQFAIKLALTKGYTSPGAATNDVRQAEIEAGWADAFPDVPKTKSQLDMLVAVTGWPNRRAIEQGLKGGKNRKA